MTLISLAGPFDGSTTRQSSSPRRSRSRGLPPTVTRTRLTSFISKEATTVLSRRSVAVLDRAWISLFSTMKTGPCSPGAATPASSPALIPLDRPRRRIFGSLAPSSQIFTVTSGLDR